MKKLLLIPMLLLPATLYAATYEWVDSKGGVNFTDDLGKVPKKYRKKVKVLGEDSGPQVTEVTESAKPAPPVKTPERQVEKKALYGGKDEKAWRSEFALAKGELKLAEQDLKDVGRRLNDTSKMTRTEYLSVSNSVKLEETRVQEKRKRLQELNSAADEAGVPVDLRQ